MGMKLNSEGGPVKKSFRSYIKGELSKVSPRVFEMAQAFSQSQIDFIINQEMANMLSLIPGLNLRARVLNWLVTEGLLEATMKRDELLDLVKAELGKQTTAGAPQTIKLPQQPQNIAPTNKLAGRYEHNNPYNPFAFNISEIRRDHALGAFGPDPADEDSELTALDLFSPEAYKRNPALASVKIGGLSPVEYYEKNFEPKYMSVEYKPGKHVRMDLGKMREKVKALGMEPFRYGGFDGYLQFMEKGDYMPEEQQRQYISPNGQYGIDLRPERKFDKETGADKVVDDVQGVDEKGNPVINFMGGSASADQERANKAVDDMRLAFQNIMYQMQSGRNTGLPPEREALIKDLLTTKKVLERMEMGIGDQGAGREGAARKLGMPDTGRGKEIIPVPPGLDLELTLKLIRIGLEQESTARDAKGFKDPEKLFGPLWDGSPETKPADGYYKLNGNKLVYKLPKAVQEAMFQKMTQPLDGDPPMLCVRFGLNDFFGKAVDRNVKVLASGMFNAAVKSRPELVEQAKMYVHKLNGIDHTDFIQEQRFAKQKIQTVKETVRDPRKPTAAPKTMIVPDPNDPIIQELMSKGYKWELFTQHERETGVPHWTGREYGILSQKGSRYKIALEDDGNYYINIPTDKAGKPFKAADFGALGNSMLSGGIRMSGGLAGGHVDYNPTGPETLEKLIDALQKGMYGEKGGASNALELPSIVKGCATARQWFDRKFAGSSKQYWPEDTHLLQYGLEGLRGFAGDPAFQVGYITDKELEAFLNREADDEIRKEMERLEDEEEYGGLMGYKGGKGIHAQLFRAGHKEEDVRQAIVQDVMDKIHDKVPLIDMGEWGEKVSAAFGKNAFGARIKAIANYVFGAMKKEASKEAEHIRHTKSFSSLGGTNADGDEGSYEAGDRNYDADDRGREVIDGKQVMRPRDLMTQFGIPEPEDEEGLSTGGASQKQTVSPPPAANVSPVGSNVTAGASKFASRYGGTPAPQPAAQEPVTPPAPVNKYASRYAPKTEGRLRAYGQWLREMTSAVYDPKKRKPRKGAGFNWEGTPGNVGGTSISGEADTAKSDPTGKKG